LPRASTLLALAFVDDYGVEQTHSADFFDPAERFELLEVGPELFAEILSSST
jgi:hypothetical protein